MVRLIWGIKLDGDTTVLYHQRPSRFTVTWQPELSLAVMDLEPGRTQLSLKSECTECARTSGMQSRRSAFGYSVDVLFYYIQVR
jgi:hypothetical protein